MLRVNVGMGTYGVGMGGVTVACGLLRFLVSK
ncbi:hypothetical protein ABID23_000967 [Bartonella silvatica]|uniref:Uncharacterized protein n=1 Tax=Bartonella silvatica TaxID=357760 RepID=A0ABV2HH70_9HYPH